MTYSNGLLAGLFEAELLGRRCTHVPTSFTNAFTCHAKRAGVIRVDPDGDPCPPYSITYNQVASGGRFLTVGDEEGCVSILDTTADTLPSSLYTDHERAPRAKWLAHNNTIFDMAWAKNDSVLYTASGDQHVGVWDTAVGRLRMYCAGHDGSVKAVCPHSTQPDMFASGSRDGGILLWDLRLPTQWNAAKNRMQLGPVHRIDIATSPEQQFGQQQQQQMHSTPGSAGKQQHSRTASARNSLPNCRRSVTSLLFVKDQHTMISSSDMDGVVKLWDLRKLTMPAADITIPTSTGSPAPNSACRRTSVGRARSAGSRRDGNTTDADTCWMGFTCPSRSSRPAGITSMALSPAGDMLLVSSIDSCHYLYSLSGLTQPPVAVFSGHRTDSFCIKACFSPCGRHILSGSSDRRAYIWDVSQPDIPPVTLRGHTGEVTAVAWCPSDHCQIVTAADDATLRVWSMDRSNTRYQETFDHCNYSFTTEGRQQGLWARLGLASKQSATGAATAPEQAETALGKLEPLRLEAASAAAAAAAAARVPAAAKKTGAPACSAATAGAANTGGKASLCSPPVTPQLPFWREAGVVQRRTPGGPAAAAGGDVCETPVSQQMKVRTGSTAVKNTTPRLRQLKLSDQLSALKPGQQRAPAQAAASSSQKGASAIAAEEEAGGGHKAAPHGQQQLNNSATAVQPDCTAAEAKAAHASAAVTGQQCHAAAGTAVAGNQGFSCWMNALTPSPASSPGSQVGNGQCPTATVGTSSVEPASVQQAQLQPQQQSGGVVASATWPSTCRRGGVVELSTPWALPTPLRQQREAEQAALEAERLQQSNRLAGLSLKDGQQAPQQLQLQRPAEWDDLPRQLQDEFEVFCDDEHGSTGLAGGAGVSAGTPVSTTPQENVWNSDPEQEVSAGDVVLSALQDALMHEAPDAEVDVVPCSLPTDVEPCSLPPNACEPTQQPQQQQQPLEVPAMQSPRRRRQEHRRIAAGGLPPLLQLSEQKARQVTVHGATCRKPLEDISALLPAAADAPLSPTGAYTVAAATVPAPPGHVMDVPASHMKSSVRALQMCSAAPGSPAAAVEAAGHADSPLLLMLQHARMSSQQHGVTGLAAKSPPRQLQHQQQHTHQSPVGSSRRLSRLGERQYSPITFGTHDRQQQYTVSPAAAPAVNGYLKRGSRQAGIMAMIQDRKAYQAEQQGHCHQQQQQQQLEAQAHHQQQYGAAAGEAQGAISEQGDADGEAPLAAAAPAGRSGGIKRSAVPPSTSKKRQCTLADLWTAKPPEVEDAASRFSPF